MEELNGDGFMPSQKGLKRHLQALPQNNLSGSSPLQETLSTNDPVPAAALQSLFNADRQPGTDQAFHPAVSESNVNDFDAERMALFSEFQHEIDQGNKNGVLEWVFDIGWPRNFAAEPGTADTLLGIIATIIRLSQEKDAVVLLHFLLNTLANAVRRHDQWRVLFGEYGIVEQCLDLMQKGDAHTSQISGTWPVSAVRLLANCCGDPLGDGSADANRAKVVAKISISQVLSMMNVPDRQTEAVSFVYNVGAYDETFRISAVAAGLLPTLWNVLRVLGQPSVQDLRSLGPACEMLTWAPDEVDVISSSDTFQVLSKISQHELPSEDMESLIETIVFILKRHGLPEKQSTFMDLLDFVLNTCTMKDRYGPNTPLPPTFSERRLLGEDEKLLEAAREPLIIQLSALSGGSTIALRWPVTSPPIKRMLDWFCASHFQLKICALTMLGNFAYQSERLITDLIEEGDLSNKLALLLKTETNGLVLKTALGAVQRFARNAQHRISLGQSGIMASIAPSWAQGINLPLQKAALWATRHLLSGSLKNINWFLTEQAPPKKCLPDVLLKTFQNSEVSETRLDIAWTLEKMWRSIYSDPEIRRMCVDEDQARDAKSISNALLRETIPTVHQKYPQIIEPFLAILTFGDKDHVIAATYTLSMIANDKGQHDAIYRTLCEGEGRAIFLTVIQDNSNRKAQLNAQTLVYQLKGFLADDVGRSVILANLIDESKTAITASAINENRALNGIGQGPEDTIVEHGQSQLQ